jgi:hypothetical protein
MAVGWPREDYGGAMGGLIVWLWALIPFELSIEIRHWTSAGMNWGGYGKAIGRYLPSVPN